MKRFAPSFLNKYSIKREATIVKHKTQALDNILNCENPLERYFGLRAGHSGGYTHVDAHTYRTTAVHNNRIKKVASPHRAHNIKPIMNQLMDRLISQLINQLMNLTFTYEAPFASRKPCGKCRNIASTIDDWSVDDRRLELQN